MAIAKKILDAQFIYSCPKLMQMANHGPELAFIGRSNVGKSSLINAITNKKDLAKCSKTPGRTRHAVVYELFLADKPSCYLVDLPGFGFAKMGKEEARACEELIYSYLEKRPNIDLLCLLLDMRRLPDEREKKIISLAKSRGIKLLLILSKSDKLAISKQIPTRNMTKKEIDLSDDDLIVFSIFDEESKISLRNRIIDEIKI